MQATKDWVYVFWRKRARSLGYASVDTVEDGLKLAARHLRNREANPVAILESTSGFVAYNQTELRKVAPNGARK